MWRALVQNIQSWMSPVVMAAILVTVVVGCQQQPEKTQDPKEIEELRQEHIKQADRERQEAN